MSPRLFWPEQQNPWDRKLLQEYGGLEGLLRGLRGLGVTHIEMRHFNPNDDGAAVLACGRAVWEAGFTLTVHGAVPEAVGPFAETCPALVPLLQEAKAHQSTVVITLHSYMTGDDANKAPAAEKTNRLLKLWGAEAAAYGFRLALELNRDKKNGDPSVTDEGVLAMLEGTDPAAVGVCFDCGHYYSNTKSETAVPSAAFLARAVHTHIHALGSGGTHFPLGEDAALPLDTYVTALARAEYAGVYHLELDFPRYPERSFRQAIRDSVIALTGAVHRALPGVDATRKAVETAYAARYPRELAAVAEKLAATREDCFYTLGPSAQAFCVGGCRFGVDPAIRSTAAREASVEAMRGILSQLSAVFITHEHDDHFDTALLRQLSDLPCTWVIGDSLSKELLAESGLPPAQVRLVKPSDRFTLQGIGVEVLEGHHFQPNGVGVPAVAYRLTVGGKQIFLPADVRDYGVDRFPPIPAPDAMVANLWLGRGQALCTDDGAVEEFCDFVACFQPKQVFLGHIWEYTREETDLWRWEHAGRVMDGLCRRLPGVPVVPLLPFHRYEV